MEASINRAEGSQTGYDPRTLSSPQEASALRLRYAQYCQQQAVELLELIPREGLRPLYAAAREWAIERGLHDAQDPMAGLHAFCRQLLPLPAFDVWAADLETHRLAHLKGEVSYRRVGEPSEPVTVELRDVEHESVQWLASLDVFRDGDLWRGYIRFHKDSDEHIRTGDIFCEDDLQELRERFLSFTSATLTAFLRSILP